MSKEFTANLYLKYFGLFKAPMLLFSGAKVNHVSEQQTIIKIPLNWRTKNHLNSMYFGALCIGADCCGGLYASMLIKESKKKVHLSFKDFHCNFKRRATEDVYFVNQQSQQIKHFFYEVIKHPNQRKNLPLKIDILTDPNDPSSTIAEANITLSLKSS